MKKVIVITGASRGFGELTANELAKAGHVVYASMCETARNAPQVDAAKKFAAENKVDLRTIELDVASQESVDAVIQHIVSENGRLDVVIHNAEHMVFGPAEAFTPKQLAEVYDINVLSAQRVNRTALPELRQQGKGLVVWVSSTSTRGGTPPYLAPYFAAKAGMDALAVSLFINRILPREIDSVWRKKSKRISECKNGSMCEGAAILSHSQVQMARELELNPAKLGKIDNHKQQPWKLPLPGSSNNSISSVSARRLPTTSRQSRSDVGSKGRKERRAVPPGSSVQGTAPEAR